MIDWLIDWLTDWLIDWFRCINRTRPVKLTWLDIIRKNMLNSFTGWHPIIFRSEGFSNLFLELRSLTFINLDKGVKVACQTHQIQIFFLCCIANASLVSKFLCQHKKSQIALFPFIELWNTSIFLRSIFLELFWTYT